MLRFSSHNSNKVDLAKVTKILGNPVTGMKYS